MSDPDLSLAELDEQEQERLKRLNFYEEQARREGFTCIAGIDEVGRGPLAGPVVAAACIIPAGIYIAYVDDSKKLSPKKRASLFEQLTQDKRICYAVGMVDSEEIDRINIYQATIQAMCLAIEHLAVRPDYLLVDGMQMRALSIPCLRIVKGDSLSQSIAAASIIAKETRDALMRHYHQLWSQYGFDQHKGYGTPQHLEALSKYGPCQIHRRSFAPLKN